MHRAALWILGEYATSLADIEAVIKQFHQTLGEGSLVDIEQRLLSGEVQEDANVTTPTVQTTTTLVTSDGTYATQSAFNTVQ